MRDTVTQYATVDHFQIPISVLSHIDKAEQTDPGFVEKLVTQIVKNVQVRAVSVKCLLVLYTYTQAFLCKVVCNARLPEIKMV